MPEAGVNGPLLKNVGGISLIKFIDMKSMIRRCMDIAGFIISPENMEQECLSAIFNNDYFWN